MTNIITGKSSLVFEPKMAVQADQADTTETPDAFRPTLGPIANLAFKVATLKFLIRLDDEPTQGRAAVTIHGQGDQLAREEMDVDGTQTITGEMRVPLHGIEGDAPLNLSVEMLSAADEGIAATVDAVLYIEQPVIVGR